MKLSASPISNKSMEETYFDIIDCLCGRFMALSPFEVLNSPTDEVYGIYVDAVIHDVKEKRKGKGKAQDEWVTSKTASWH